MPREIDPTIIIGCAGGMVHYRINRVYPSTPDESETWTVERQYDQMDLPTPQPWVMLCEPQKTHRLALERVMAEIGW